MFAGQPHHVTQRGNYSQAVFENDSERLEYLDFLRRYKEERALEVLAWCLMNNHVHLVCVPRRDDSLSKTLHHTHMRYANAANRRRGQQGHFWQGRFYSCVLEGRHLAMAIRYVERNPVRARLVRYAESYRWSSAAFHVKGKPDGMTNATDRFGDVTEGIEGGWRAWLRLGDREDYCQALRSSCSDFQALKNLRE